MRRTYFFALLSSVIVPLAAAAQDCCAPAEPAACCSCQAAAPAPAPPEFGGCLCCRPKLTGDWWCHRTCMAENGITFDADVTQFYQGVASGGREQVFSYSGHGDYLLNMDLGKLGVHEGLFLKVRAEENWGELIHRESGAIMNPALLPSLPDGDADGIALTNVLFTQFLSENFAVYAGKLDTLDGDANAFAHGRGKTQFMNNAFVATPILLRAVPYSTLGAGFIVLEQGQPIFNFGVLNATNTATTSGFDELFEEGAALIAELRLPTQFFCMPGHQLIGGVWNSRDFLGFSDDPRIPDSPINFPLVQQEGSWAVYYNFDQYLYTDPCNPALGWGVFGRAGVADEITNPIEFFLSAGLGGNSMLAGRSADTWGIGYYFLGLSSNLPPILPLDDEQGVELWYNYRATKWLEVTPDLQIIDGGFSNFDTSVIAGMRVNLIF